MLCTILNITNLYFCTKVIKLVPRIRNISIVVFICFLFSLETFSQQKIGLVLSGGGATGLAHIGVLKALEENGIEIDFITGTSAGALVGALYSSGYSPEEIESYVLSPDFQIITSGEKKSNQRFLIREEEEDANLFNLEFSINKPLKKSLPTNIISSSYLDFEMFKLLAPASAYSKNNFDSLFIPFRCVSSDITNKESVIFSKGNLNEVVRSSMTFPFYLNPIKIDGNLLFDGGLYNNFPADVMYTEFNPDYIIGSNVSYNPPPPTDDDLIGQVINMLVFHSDFDLPCENGIVIKPQTNVTTFEFENVQEAIRDGYETTLKKIDSILISVKSTTTKESIQIKREKFREKTNNVNIVNIDTYLNDSKVNVQYAKKSMLNSKKEKSLTLLEIEKRYYRLYNSQHIDFIFPTLSNVSDSNFNLNINIKKSKELKLHVGGHFSSRPINTGYLGLTYKHLSKRATSLKAESYFGKFYGSVRTVGEVEVPSRFPITLSGYYVMNRWDYFRNFSTFFESVKPSFLVQNETYFGAKIKHSIGNNQISTIDFRAFSLEDDYYQNLNFSNKDTTDKTYFSGQSIRWEFLQNSLNRKQFATSGQFLSIKIKYINGKEHFIRGTNSSTSEKEIFQNHNWISFNTTFQSFIINSPSFHLGFYGKGVFNTQSLFSNYTSSLLAMSSFSPTPDIETYFLPEYRSPQHIGVGINTIFSIRKKIDFRFDGFYYQPFVKITNNETTGDFGYSKPFKGNEFLASSSIIYHSFFGPLRATVNYFPHQNTSIAFQLSFGYVIFNERAIR
jgi:NTE family protein